MDLNDGGGTGDGDTSNTNNANANDNATINNGTTDNVNATTNATANVDGNANANSTITTAANLDNDWAGYDDEQDDYTQYTSHYKDNGDRRDPFEATFDPKKGNQKDHFRRMVKKQGKARRMEKKQRKEAKRKAGKENGIDSGDADDFYRSISNWDGDDTSGPDDDSDDDGAASVDSNDPTLLATRSVQEKTKHFQNLTDLFQRRILETLSIHTQSKLASQTRSVFERYGKFGSGDRLRVGIESFLKGDVVGSMSETTMGKAKTAGNNAAKRKYGHDETNANPIANNAAAPWTDPRFKIGLVAPNPNNTTSLSTTTTTSTAPTNINLSHQLKSILKPHLKSNTNPIPDAKNDGDDSVKPGFESAVGDAIRFGSGGGLGVIRRPDITSHISNLPSTSTQHQSNANTNIKPTAKLQLRLWPDLDAMKAAGGIDDREVVEAMLIDAADVVEDEVNEDWDEDELEEWETGGFDVDNGGMIDEVLLGMAMAEQSKMEMDAAVSGIGGDRRWFKSINSTSMKINHNNTEASTNPHTSSTKSNLTDHTHKPSTRNLKHKPPRSNDPLTSHHLTPHHALYSPFHPLDVSLQFPQRLKLPLSYLTFLNSVHALYNTYALSLLRHHTTKYGPEPIFRPGIRDLLRSELDDLITSTSREALGLDLGPERRRFLREVNARACGGGRYESGRGTAITRHPHQARSAQTTPANTTTHPGEAIPSGPNSNAANNNGFNTLEDISIELAIPGGREGNGILNPAERRILSAALGFLEEEIEEVWDSMEGKRHGLNVGGMYRVIAAKEVERFRRERGREKARGQTMDTGVERVVGAVPGDGRLRERVMEMEVREKEEREKVVKKAKTVQSKASREFMVRVQALGDADYMDVD